MAKILRKLQKIFALNNDATQNFGNGVFGSGKNETKQITNDVETLQSLTAWGVGWKDAVLINAAGNPNLPPLEETQAIDYIVTYQLAYIFQEGVPEYNSLTTYFQKSIAKKTTTYELYGSVTDSNIGNALSDPTNWLLLGDLSQMVTTAETSTTDGQLMVASGTGGRTLKKSTISGLLKQSGNVVQQAVAGVDYVTPGGSGSAQVSKVWINFNGQGVIAIRDSLNVSSITDDGTGDYEVNFSISLSNTNYCAVFGGKEQPTGVSETAMAGLADQAYANLFFTNKIRVAGRDTATGALIDMTYMGVTIFAN